MKISALQEYGLRCLLQLAKSSLNGPISAEEIARKEALSISYTEKILQKLSRSGFVKSIRGAGGGYILSRKPEDIIIGNVMRIVDGSFFSELCNHFSGNEDECTHLGQCSIRPLWMNIYKYIYDVLDHTTLQDLMDEEKASRLLISEKFKNSEKIIAVN